MMKVFLRRGEWLEIIKSYNFSRVFQEDKDFNWRVHVPKPLEKVTEIGPNIVKYWI